MKIPVALVCAILFTSGATAIYTLWDEAPENPAPGDDNRTAGDPHDRHGHDHPTERSAEVPLQSLSGRVPTLTDAMMKLDRHPPIVIRDDADFNPANGVRRGSGTPDDPYIIEGWLVDLVVISDTSAWFEIRNNYVTDILILDWNGPGALVHHNHLNDLRTNRNVARTGDATGGVIAYNEIVRVEQLRHYDGEMAHNRIGDPDRLPLTGERVVFDIAGFNGARIHHNEIWGGVDMKLHGHHHASGFAHGHSHNHGAADAVQNETRHEDHTVRYIELDFHDNVIHDDGFGVRWNDLNHAGDDQQANSEQEPDLELPHVHHTRIRIANNTIDGATLRVTVFNAPDKLHLANEGHLLVENNTVAQPLAGSGLVVQDVRDAEVLLRGNTVQRDGLRLSGMSAILLQRFTNATVTILDSDLKGYRIGVQAREFDATTTWAVEGVSAEGAEHPVYWDRTVANPPEGHAEDDDGHANHDHDAPGSKAWDSSTFATIPT